nr:unnamed protein product [Leishmania braziliensis]
MPPRQGKRHDLAVWGPPPPLPASSTQASLSAASSGGAALAPGPLSAFQKRFANRTEVVGKGGANAHLGVAGALARADDAASTVQPKPGILAPLPPSRKRTPPEAMGTAAVFSAPSAQTVVAAGKHIAKTPERIRIVAPSEQTRLPLPLLPQENTPTSSPTPGLHRGSRTSRSPTPAAPEERVAVKCILAPSAAAAIAARFFAAPGNGIAETISPSWLPLQHGTGLRRRSSTALSSLGPSMASPHIQSPAKAAAVSLTPPPLSTRPDRGELFSVPQPNHLFGPPMKHHRPALTVTAASPGHPQHSQLVKALSPPATSLNAGRYAAAAASRSTSDGNKSVTHKPHSLKAYKALMADVAARKFGGLGPSDTDEQRAAREKRERAKAYAKRAMEVARASLAGVGSRACEDKGDPGTITTTPVSPSADAGRKRGLSSARSSSSDTSATTTTTTTTCTLTSRSASAEPIEHHRQTRRRATRSAPPPQGTPPRHVKSKPPRASTPLSQLPAAVVNNDVLPLSCSEEESTNSKSPKAVPSPSPAPPRASPAVAPFAVAAASRRQTKQARQRRERALAYAREVSQKRQLPPTAECEDDDETCTAPRAGRVVKNGATEDADEDDMQLGGAACVSSLSAVRGADTFSLDRAQRLQRLLDLEALHAKKKEAVEVIRRHLCAREQTRG